MEKSVQTSAFIRPLNLERLHEATDEQLAVAYAAALVMAHNAPREIAGDPPVLNGSMAWAARSREAFRLGGEIARRKNC